MSYLGGIDIGGTKCAVSIGKTNLDNIEILYKEKFPTPKEPLEVVQKLVTTLKEMLNKHKIKLDAIGISCGGPLNSEKGVILSPPNLSNWDNIDIITPFKNEFNISVAVQNDANACALAEWLWGAGKGTKNMIFLTFGTGMGAGLILNGKLYSGTNDMAGEVGHIRIADDGPNGYGKNGSFEGFCSGAGIAKLAKPIIREWVSNGKSTKILDYQNDISKITTEDIGLACKLGDELAINILNKAGKNLGKGISILIDILNPECIVIGSIYNRQEEFLKESMWSVIKEEALLQSREVCKIVPAKLSEQLGDYAALSVARNLTL